MTLFLKKLPNIERALSRSVPRYFGTKSKEHAECSRAVNEAEKIVGYPTSFLSLRWLLNDEVANIALNLRKLIGTNHPLLDTARELILNKETPTWGLIVLLVSKAGGLSREFSAVDHDITAGILHSQRVLSEITEMVRTSNLIHKSILNIPQDDLDAEDLNFGNKLSLLTGDYLLSSSFKELAGLKCHEVNELVSTCLRDLVEAEFIEPRDSQNRPLPAPPLGKQNDIVVPNQFDGELCTISEVLGNAKAEWTLRHLLDGASLLAKCCQGSLMLANHPKPLQKAGYLFGRNLALAVQANKDETIFEPLKTGSFSLVCAPLLFHLQSDPDFHKVLVKNAQENSTDYGEIRRVVRAGPGLERTRELRGEFASKASEVLKEFPDSEAREALANIIKTI
ncbi:unnamed protein product [Phaedon cochleariae]|uniref:Uncharacterized protein n=1 Tax=Phaedon cochleariae TaxID=80249 RepID=A0A9N9X0A3_PHACE|nr:unnamed protein product [Phaedon cochleariae]